MILGESKTCLSGHFFLILCLQPRFQCFSLLNWKKPWRRVCFVWLQVLLILRFSLQVWRNVKQAENRSDQRHRGIVLFASVVYDCFLCKRLIRYRDELAKVTARLSKGWKPDTLFLLLQDVFPQMIGESFIQMFFDKK